MECKICSEDVKKVKQYSVDYIYALACESIKRLWIIIVILAILLAGSVTALVYMYLNTETVITEEEYEARTDDGGTAVANGSGEVTFYGVR